MSKQWANGKDGRFNRQVSSFRETISPSHPVYKPAKGRYWLYVSLACPWAHRTLIARALKGLTSIIGVSVVHWHLDEDGWRFLSPESKGHTDQANSKAPYTYSGGITTTELDKSSPQGQVSNDSARLYVDATFEPNYHLTRLKELYLKTNPEYSARVTVPVLWDMQTETIVNNESSEIIRILNSGVFDEFTEEPANIDLFPSALQPEIEEFNSWVYDNINNGVYKTGFAEKSSVYEEEVQNVFKHLDKVESILQDKYKQLEDKYGKNDINSILAEYYTVGNQLTEADVRLYTTIVRFDPVYVQHFKCNLTTIRNGYPYTHLWLRNLYWNHKAFQLTTNFDHIKLHYTRSHTRINPLGITPLGPTPDILPL